MINASNWKEFKMANIFDIEHVKKFTLPNKPYVMDGDIISPDGINPYIAAISTNNGIKGYSNYNVNNEGDCITLSTTADSSNTVFYQKNAFIGRQQIAGIRRKDGIMGEHCGLFIVSVLKPLLRLFNYGNKLTIDYLRDLYIMLPTTPSGEPDWDFMERYIAELEEERVAELEAYLVSTGLDDYELTEEDKEVLNASPEWGEFRIGDLFEVSSPKKRFNANAVKFDGEYPYVARGSSNNGIRGYITEDTKYLSPANSLSFGQDTATIYYQPEPYFTGDKIKVMVLRNYELTETLATYFITAISKAFSGFAWGQNSFNENVIKNTLIKLPVLSNGTPDFKYMEKYIRAIEKLTIQGVVEWKDNEIEKTKEIIKEAI